MENLKNILFSAAKETNQLYFDSLVEISKSIAEYNEVLDKNFLSKVDHYIEALKEKSLYNSLEFFWVESLEKLFYLADLSLEYQEDFESNEQLEEELFDYFLNTEFLHLFNEAQKNKQNPWETAADVMSIMQNNLLAFYALQIDPNPEESYEQPISYFYPPEMGDFEKYFYVKDKVYLRPDKEDFLRLTKVKSNEIECALSDGKKLTPQLADEQMIFTIGHLNFRLAHIDEKLTTEKLIKKCQRALNTLQEYAPNCFTFLKQYSNEIILLKEENVVSYSMQNLPAYSFINIFDRDDIDLLDDLIHENGHHILNSILNSSELINEDDEKIFYSPWRRSLRPIRGIYHAYCTFYWALEVFCEMYNNHIFICTDYSGSEKLKLLHRIYEEYLFLIESEPVMKYAYQQGKITKTGWQVAKTFRDHIRSKADIFDKVKEALENSPSDYVKNLVEATNETLEEMGHYKNT